MKIEITSKQKQYLKKFKAHNTEEIAMLNKLKELDEEATSHRLTQKDFYHYFKMLGFETISITSKKEDYLAKVKTLVDYQRDIFYHPMGLIITPRFYQGYQKIEPELDGCGICFMGLSYEYPLRVMHKSGGTCSDKYGNFIHYGSVNNSGHINIFDTLSQIMKNCLILSEIPDECAKECSSTFHFSVAEIKQMPHHVYKFMNGDKYLEDLQSMTNNEQKSNRNGDKRLWELMMGDQKIWAENYQTLPENSEVKKRKRKV